MYLVDTSPLRVETQTTRVPVHVRVLTLGIPAPFTESRQLAQLTNRSRLFRLPKGSLTVFLNNPTKQKILRIVIVVFVCLLFNTITHNNVSLDWAFYMFKYFAKKTAKVKL